MTFLTLTWITDVYNRYVTRVVFAIIPVFPVLAEGGAGDRCCAPDHWLTVTYKEAHPPGPALQAVQVPAKLTVLVHWAVPVQLLGQGEVSPG